MESLDPILIEQFQEMYLELYGEELGTSEAEMQLREIALVLHGTEIIREAVKNDSNA